MITPTIGRKVWFWPVSEQQMMQHSPDQALDATIIYVHSDSHVNLHIIDHNGREHVRINMFLFPDADITKRPGSSCATWMPYQQGQAKANA